MNRRILPGLAVMMALSALPGCGRYYWSKPGATLEQFTGDSRECLDEAKAKVPAAPTDVAAGAVGHLYRACRAARGCARAKAIEAAPPTSYRGLESAGDFAGTVPPASAAPVTHQLDGRWHRVGSGPATLTLADTRDRCHVGLRSVRQPGARRPLAAAGAPARWMARR